MIPRKDSGSAWSANGISAKGVCEQHPFGGQPVQRRGNNMLMQTRVIVFGAVSTNGMGGMIITENKNDVRPFS